MRDIFDLGINLNNFDKIINYISIYPFPHLNYIHISYCSNNVYTTLTYTSILSILISKAYYTYIQLMCRYHHKKMNHHSFQLLYSI